MQSETLVSIVIPCYNYGNYLSEAVESALAQTHQLIQIIVVDDGSTDGTRDVVRRFGDRVQYIHQTNGGSSKARNTGLGYAKGDYVVCLDADDILLPSYVEKLLAAHRESSDSMLGFVYTQVELFGTQQGVSTPPEFSVQQLKRGNFIHVASMIRIDALRRTGYDENLKTGWEDWDLYLRLVEMGYYGRLVAEPLLRYRQHQSPAHIYSNIRDADGQRKLRLTIIKRHPKLFSRFAYLRTLTSPYVRPAWESLSAMMKFARLR